MTPHEGRAAAPPPPPAGPRQRERSNLPAAAPDALARARRRPARRAPAAASDRALLLSSPARDAAPLGALPRRACSAGRRTWRDVYRHVFTLLRDRARPRLPAAGALRRVPASRPSGIEAILERRSRAATACSPVGAHLGSFEALRMLGHDKGLRVAMIMYEDNARADQRDARRDRAEAPSCTRSRSAASTRCCAAPLARRRRPRRPARRPHPARPTRSARRRIALPFLGAPARFSDGPFRLAAMLRRTVVFMAGLYRGGNRYDLRFVAARRLPARGRRHGERDALIGAGDRALRRDARGAVPRGAVQLVQLLRLLGRADADAADRRRLSVVAACAALARAARSALAAALARVGRARPPAFDLRADAAARHASSRARRPSSRRARVECSTARSSRRAACRSRRPTPSSARR